MDASTRIKENLQGLSVRTKGSADKGSLKTCQPSQADWIRQYMEQQEEVSELNELFLILYSMDFSLFSAVWIKYLFNCMDFATVCVRIKFV